MLSGLIALILSVNFIKILIVRQTETVHRCSIRFDVIPTVRCTDAALIKRSLPDDGVHLGFA